MILLTRAAHFNAAHRYHNPRLSDEENRSIFGACNNAHGHGHNYDLEVTVAGEIDPDTGMVLNLSEIDRVVREQVVDHLDHRNLNLDIPHFVERIPTTENLATYVFALLEPHLTRDNCRLHRVRLWESRDLYVDAGAPD